MIFKADSADAENSCPRKELFNLHLSVLPNNKIKCQMKLN